MRVSTLHYPMHYRAEKISVFKHLKYFWRENISKVYYCVYLVYEVLLSRYCAQARPSTAPGLGVYQVQSD